MELMRCYMHLLMGSAGALVKVIKVEKNTFVACYKKKKRREHISLNRTDLTYFANSQKEHFTIKKEINK